VQIDSAIVGQLADSLKEYFPTKMEFDRAIADIQKRAFARLSSGRSSDWSITTVLRGLAAQRGGVINPDTAAADIAYAQKALSTSANPGAYLIPAIQAAEILGILTNGGVARQSGVRVWPMAGIQKLTIPAATAFPTVEFLGQNSAQSASDANLGQVAFDLKTRRSLTVLPNELVAASTPSIDSFVTELLGQAFAEHEDSIFFAASAASGGPTPVYATANISTLNAAGGSANGGNLTYQDILAVLAKFAAVKAKGPCAFYMSPRTFYQRALGLLDLQSRPILVSDPAAPAQFRLFGWPVWVTPAIPENLSVGSGSNQSYILFTNPGSYLHLAQSESLEIAVSTERYFELNQIGIRAAQGIDFAAAPAAGCVVLKGVN